jgi:MYXO-CTERM domain-containing protein
VGEPADAAAPVEARAAHEASVRADEAGLSPPLPEPEADAANAKPRPPVDGCGCSVGRASPHAPIGLTLGLVVALLAIARRRRGQPRLWTTDVCCPMPDRR